MLKLTQTFEFISGYVWIACLRNYILLIKINNGASFPYEAKIYISKLRETYLVSI